MKSPELPTAPAGPRQEAPEPAATAPWRARLHEIIYEADTPAGKAFDVALIVVILLSVLVVMLESVHSIAQRFGVALRVLEWTFTITFTIEYILRLVSVRRPVGYMRSFFGIVDVLAVLPTYLSLVLPGSQSLVVVRFLRLLRIFRVFKLAEYLHEAQLLKDSLLASRRKVTVFFTAVITLVVIIGAVMYLIEGERSGFTSIPRSVYWTIVTLTTVGYGDIAPRTPLGQFLAAIVMLLGYSIIAVPTGIVTAEMTRAHFGRVTTRACPVCSLEGHDPDARFCKHCGSTLQPACGA